MKLLAVDPGVTTGYCFAELTDNRLKYTPYQMPDDVEDLWNRLRSFAPEHVICEDFEFRGKARTGLVLFSVQLIGVCRLYEALMNGKPQVHLQKAAQGKSYYSDKLLKDRGIYKRGVPHGMDATRHLLHWLTFGFGYQFTVEKLNDPINFIEVSYAEW